MKMLTSQKTGVLGVLGVPKTLEARGYMACSQGTHLDKRRNTKVPEHERCSMIEAALPVPQPTPAQTPSPSCGPIFRFVHAIDQCPAQFCLRLLGRGGRQIANGALL